MIVAQLIAARQAEYFGTLWWFYSVAAVATIGLYSILYRENKFYRLVEHIYLGLSAGVVIALTWTQEMRGIWWVPFYDMGYYWWIIPVPIAMLGYTVFSKNTGWMSRVPIGILLGLWAGQRFKEFANRWLPQVQKTMLPVIPNSPGLYPGPKAAPVDALYASTAINNLLLVLTTLAVLSYFFFSFEQKSRLVKGSSTTGRWLLMVAFGAIFGSTIMNRFILMIDRMYFLLIEWLHVRPPM
jgi:hypothetical protein